MGKQNVTFEINDGPCRTALNNAIAGDDPVEFLQKLPDGQSSTIKAKVFNCEKKDKEGFLCSMSIFVMSESQTSIVKERNYFMQYDSVNRKGKIILV